MRQTIIMIAGCALFSVGSLAQAARQADASSGSSHAIFDGVRKVSGLLRTHAVNRANENIANVSDVVLDPDGTVRYVILSHGGVAGIGAKYTAIPWDGLNVRHVDGKWAVDLDMTKDALARAPTFQQEHYKDLADPGFVRRIHEFFRPRAESQASSADRKGQQQGLPMVLRASKILGAKLKDQRNENSGSVEDLLLDRNHRVGFAIVGRGGILGIGENYIPVPWSKLRLNYDRESTGVTAQIDASREQLEKAPLVKGDTFATMLAPGFVEQVYRYFGVQPSK